jgi:hypothetical protein
MFYLILLYVFYLKYDVIIDHLSVLKDALGTQIQMCNAVAVVTVTLRNTNVIVLLVG